MAARVLLLPGDGIGAEIVEAATRVLQHTSERWSLELELETALIGGAAMDATGDPLPPETLAACRESDAVLLGAVGGPKWSDPNAPVRPELGLLRLRKEFDLFANLRPVQVFPALTDHAPLRADLLDDVDILFVRELTSGIYFGAHTEQGDEDEAHDVMTYRVHEVERITRVAFEAARKRDRRVASVDKANVLASMRLWRRTVEKIAADYPDVVTVPGTDLPNCVLKVLRWRCVPTALRLRRSPVGSPAVSRPVASSSSLRHVTFPGRRPIQPLSHRIARSPPFL